MKKIYMVVIDTPIPEMKIEKVEQELLKSFPNETFICSTSKGAITIAYPEGGTKPEKVTRALRNLKDEECQL